MKRIENEKTYFLKKKIEIFFSEFSTCIRGACYIQMRAIYVELRYLYHIENKSCNWNIAAFWCLFLIQVSFFSLNQILQWGIEDRCSSIKAKQLINENKFAEGFEMLLACSSRARSAMMGYIKKTVRTEVREMCKVSEQTLI